MLSPLLELYVPSRRSGFFTLRRVFVARSVCVCEVCFLFREGGGGQRSERRIMHNNNTIPIVKLLGLETKNVNIYCHQHAIHFMGREDQAYRSVKQEHEGVCIFGVYNSM